MILRHRVILTATLRLKFEAQNSLELGQAQGPGPLAGYRGDCTNGRSVGSARPTIPHLASPSGSRGFALRSLQTFQAICAIWKNTYLKTTQLSVFLLEGFAIPAEATRGFDWLSLILMWFSLISIITSWYRCVDFVGRFFLLGRGSGPLNSYSREAIWLSLIHIWRCRRYAVCRSRWSPYH